MSSIIVKMLLIVALGPSRSALLILMLTGLLGLSFLSVVILLILKCRSKQSKVVKGKTVAKF